jgi:hypothetical protein
MINELYHSLQYKQIYIDNIKFIRDLIKEEGKVNKIISTALTSIPELHNEVYSVEVLDKLIYNKETKYRESCESFFGKIKTWFSNLFSDFKKQNDQIKDFLNDLNKLPLTDSTLEPIKIKLIPKAEFKKISDKLNNSLNTAKPLIKKLISLASTRFDTNKQNELMKINEQLEKQTKLLDSISDLVETEDTLKKLGYTKADILSCFKQWLSSFETVFQFESDLFNSLKDESETTSIFQLYARTEYKFLIAYGRLNVILYRNLIRLAKNIKMKYA